MKNQTAEAIADITTTGSTLRDNHLRPLFVDGTVLKSQAGLFKVAHGRLGRCARAAGGAAREGSVSVSAPRSRRARPGASGGRSGSLARARRQVARGIGGGEVAPALERAPGAEVRCGATPGAPARGRSANISVRPAHLVEAENALSGEDYALGRPSKKYRAARSAPPNRASATSA